MKHPDIFSGFQAFYAEIESLEDKARQSYLHLGLFLLGHEYVDLFNAYQPTDPQSIFADAVDYGLTRSSNDLRTGYSSGDEFSYIVTCKDALYEMTKILENDDRRSEKDIWKAIRENKLKLSRENRIKEQYEIIMLVCTFKNEFSKAAKPFLIKIDQERVKFYQNQYLTPAARTVEAS